MIFQIRKRIIDFIKVPIVGDNRDYVAEFRFDDEWSNAVKTVRFTQVKTGDHVDVVLNDDKCLIPVEVLKHGYIRVGVFSADMTTNYCEVYVAESIKEKDGAVIPPSEDVYAQLVGLIEDLKAYVDEQNAELKKYVDEHIIPGPEPEPEPEPEPDPDVPGGTWQLKTTTDKRYVIIGTDDDNYGNPKFFRLLRSYGLPYTMNVEAENVSAEKNLGSDVDDAIFTAADAPALFAGGVNIIDFGKYLHDSGKGEVAQHGASSDTLWDSGKLTGAFLDGLYDTYAAHGGTKSKDQLKAAIIEQKADSDVQNDAPYVETSRGIIQDAYGFQITTAGAWGGNPTATIDGITLSLNAIKDGAYDWQRHNYYGASTRIATFRNNTTAYDVARMNDSPREIDTYIDRLAYGKAVEFFWHMPFSDFDASDYRDLFERLNGMRSDGKIEIVTRHQYAMLGEYVANPVTAITVARDAIQQGDEDSKSAYVVTATYADGNTADVSAEAIIDNSMVNTSEAGSYSVYAYYRGFSAAGTVTVVGGGYTVPDGLKDKSYWYIADDTTQNVMYAFNTDGTINSVWRNSGMLTMSCTDGRYSAWKSIDGGSTWTKTANSVIHYKTVKGNQVFDGIQANDVISFVETSGNFDIEY